MPPVLQNGSNPFSTRALLVSCEECGGSIHLTRSSYKEEGGKHYHLEKNKNCWQLHLKRLVAQAQTT